MIKFEHPYANVIEFRAADVVTTSGNDCAVDCSDDVVDCPNDAGEW